MRPRNHALGLGLLLGAAITVPALAQTSGGQAYPTCTGKTVTQADSDAAHSKYLAGKVDYDEAKYDAAIAQFREAYARDCNKHDLLIIISRAYELKGDKQEAIRALEAYLDRVPPNAPDTSAHRNRLENMKKALAEAPPQPTGTATSSPTAGPTGTSAPPPPPPQEQNEHTIYPWLVVGAGGVAAAVGAVLLATAPSLPTGCDEGNGTCTRLPGETEAQYQDRREQAGASVQQPIWGIVTLAAGGALIAGGLVWHFLEPTGPKEQEAGKLKVRPLVAPGYGGVALGARF